MIRLVPYVLAVTVGAPAATGAASPAEDAGQEHAALAKALPVAEVSLHKGAEWRTVTEKLY